VDVATSRGPVPVDLGVIFTNTWTYPNFAALLDVLDVPTFAGALDFGASFGPDDTWSNALPHDGPLWSRIADECSRFEHLMFEVANMPAERRELPLDHYLREGGYSEEFIDKALVPAIAALLVTGGAIREMRASLAANLFNGYFSFFSPTTWRFFENGSREYVSRIAAGLSGRVLTSTKVVSVRRGPEGVIVEDSRGNEACYDEVVLALPADAARAILSDATPLEAKLLGEFVYRPATVHLHTDPRVLSPYLPRSTVFQYHHAGADVGPELTGALTYNAAAAFGAEGALVTVYWEGTRAPPPQGILATRHWAHHIVTTRSTAARARLGEIQGKDRTWFAGGYTIYTSHDGAFVSGLVIAEALGARYPFEDRLLARKRYAELRTVMFPERAKAG
jgi:predicted NAD/FAD-binding protein